METTCIWFLSPYIVCYWLRYDLYIFAALTGGSWMLGWLTCLSFLPLLTHTHHTHIYIYIYIYLFIDWFDFVWCFQGYIICNAWWSLLWVLLLNWDLRVQDFECWLNFAHSAFTTYWFIKNVCMLFLRTTTTHCYGNVGESDSILLCMGKSICFIFLFILYCSLMIIFLPNGLLWLDFFVWRIIILFSVKHWFLIK